VDVGEVISFVVCVTGGQQLSARSTLGKVLYCKRAS